MGILRILLATSVVIAHSESILGLRLVGGVVAVQTFFIISGFYMSMILDKKYLGPNSYSLFLSNRFLRLFPIYWSILILSIVASSLSFFIFGDWMQLSAYIDYLNSMRFGSIFFLGLANIFIFGQDIALFLGLNPEAGTLYFTQDFTISTPMVHEFLIVPQAWTLGIELTFYVVAPFLVRRNLLVVTSIIIASFLIRFFIYFCLGHAQDPWTYRFFPSELGLFLLGNLSYRMYKIGTSKRYLDRFKACLIAGIFFLTTFAYQEIFPQGNDPNLLFYVFTCLALPFIFYLTKNSKYDAYIGEFSYPIYISHVLVLGFVSPVTDFLHLDMLKGELTLLISLSIAYWLIKLIANPIETFRQSRIKAHFKIHSKPSSR